MIYDAASSKILTRYSSRLVFSARDPRRPAPVSGRDLRDAIIVMLRVIDRLDPQYDALTEIERKAMESLQRSVIGRVPGSEVYAE